MQIISYLNRCINGQDGRFSAASSGMILTSFCLVFIIVNAPQHSGETTNSYWVLEGAVLILGVFSSMGLWISVLRQRRLQLRNDSNKDLTRKIKIVFLWIFGLLCIIMACYDLAVNFDCLSLHKPRSFQGQFELGIATHCFKILFYLVQLGFLSSFAGYALVISIIQNYMISWIILTHLVIWFMNFYGTMHRKMHPNTHNETTVQLNYSCFYQSSNQEFRNKLNPFYKPAITEFSLLAAELLMMMWIYSSSDISNDEEHEFSYVSGDNETTSLIQYPVGNPSAPNRHFITNTFYFCVLIGTLLSLPFVVSCVVILYSEQPRFIHYEAFLVLLLIFYIEHFLLILATFVQVRKFSQWRDIRITTFSKNKSILLLITLTGAIVYSTLEILAVIQVTTCSKLDSLDFKIRIIVFMKTLFEMITMFLQTLLIRQSWHMEKCTAVNKIPIIKRLFGTLCLINLVIWLVFSVLYDRHTRTTIIEACFYGKGFWYQIRDGVFPITVFYRFHVSMHFYERCRKYH